MEHASTPPRAMQLVSPRGGGEVPVTKFTRPSSPPPLDLGLPRCTEGPWSTSYKFPFLVVAGPTVRGGTEPDYFSSLPTELHLYILHLIADERQLGIVAQVSRKWNALYVSSELRGTRLIILPHTLNTPLTVLQGEQRVAVARALCDEVRLHERRAQDVDAPQEPRALRGAEGARRCSW